ncbi:amidase domain-containing protein [Actinomadura macra]|uniref:amidase domain-containing protein n=1 Tax=Actinomadura macra TaxID=46164 RepID=UPI0014716D93|nr:amidase domain-containing protein [Actinomadura macra]
MSFLLVLVAIPGTAMAAGPPQTPVKLKAGPVESTGGAVVFSDKPTLKATATDPDGDALNYAFELLDEATQAVHTFTAEKVPSGQEAKAVVTGNLRNPGVFKFRVRASDGASTSEWSGWKQFTVDAPLAPTELTPRGSTPRIDPENPVLSGVVSRPSGRPVTGKFFLYDEAGNPVEPRPYAEGIASSSESPRVSLRLPDNFVKEGKTYRWRLQACVEWVCNETFGDKRFTVPATPSAPTPQTVTLGKDKLSIATGRSAADACSGKPCPLDPGSQVRVGGSGAEELISLVKVNMAALPARARIVSAKLNLGTPSCAPGCPGAGKVAAHQVKASLPDNPTGHDVLASSLPDPVGESALDDARIDLGGLANIWQNNPSTAASLALTAKNAADTVAFGADGAPEKMSVVLEYLAAGPPGKVPEISARAGEGGALAVWAPPDDLGAHAPEEQKVVQDYELQVLDTYDTPERTIRVKDLRAVVTGLNNTKSYKFRVRARTAYGVGEWAESKVFTPAAVPGGQQRYLDGMRQYALSREGLLEGKYSDAEQAVSTSSQGGTFRSVLYTEAEQLLATRAYGAAGNAAQVSTQMNPVDTLVSYSPNEQTVTVRTTLRGTTVYANDYGTGAEKRVTNTFVRTGDFTFTLPPSDKLGSTADASPTLVQSVAALGADGPIIGIERVNAYTAEQARQLQGLGKDQSFPLNSTGGKVSETKKRVAARLWPVNNRNIGVWAAEKAPTEEHEYGQDCTNFISKAIRHGGGAEEVDGDRESDKAWWENRKVKLFWRKDSYTWAAVVNNHRHFSSQGRVYWEKTYDEVTVGDSMYWESKAKKTLTHASIVSQVTAPSQYGIYYAQHNSPNHDTYKPLWQGLAPGNYSALGFAFVLW